MATPPRRKQWSPDSWIQVILVGALATGFVLLIISMVVRAVVPAYDIDSSVMLEIFNRFSALFAVVVGYVLGSQKKD